jgi:hypothetical protein
MNKVTAELLIEAKRQVESEGWRARSYSLHFLHWLRIKDHDLADCDGPESQKWFAGLEVNVGPMQPMLSYDGPAGIGQNFIDLETGDRF